MSDYSFEANASITQGSTTLTPLRSIGVSEEAAQIDTTGAKDALKTFEAGIPDLTVTAEIVGATTIVTGTKGALTVQWTDGSTRGVLANSVCVSSTINGSLDGEITSSLTFKPCRA